MTLEKPTDSVPAEDDTYRESEDEDYNEQGEYRLIFLL
jgi:hypothetical protein